VELVAFEGRGLHGGKRCGVRLRRRPGPLAFLQGAREVTLGELEVACADHGVRLRAGSLDSEIELVEHLFAALAGLGIRSGIEITVSGGEIPLLDGCALELSRALIALDPPHGSPRLRVARDGELRVGDSRYELRKQDALELEVEVDFSEEGLGQQRARWGGNAAEFVREIAPARTFGFARDAEQLRRSGRARWVDPAVVLVFLPDGSVLPPAAPAAKDELARHKLLDLLGDAYLHGGPPIGVVQAYRPGHSANHRAFRAALAQGLIVSAGR
jgi:UDP-3-O-[3-hydroxymyristoyl] N-acetylglucosamine deacetylase